MIVAEGLYSKVRVAVFGRTRPTAYFSEVPIRPGPMRLAVKASIAAFSAVVLPPTSPQISRLR